MRNRRLLILCYHGISVGEEHSYNPEMFMRTNTFEQRIRALKDCRANVLGLDEAVRLLSQNRLPQRSVVITFDDGWADFHANAFPILQRYGYPATVYLTTYYCLYNKPIFRFALGYILWRRRTAAVDNHRFSFLPERFDLRTAESRVAIVAQFDRYAKEHNFSGAAKNDLVAEVASSFGFDYQDLARERLFHLMTPAEVAEIAAGGIDLQLHTHRHRTPLQRDLFLAEINDNRHHIQEITGRDSRYVHFCYPSGAIRPDFIGWLRDAGVQSATTCLPDYATTLQEPLSLPRLLDHDRLSENEFEAWISGFAALLPRRTQTWEV